MKSGSSFLSPNKSCSECHCFNSFYGGFNYYIFLDQLVHFGNYYIFVLIHLLNVLSVLNPYNCHCAELLGLKQIKKTCRKLKTAPHSLILKFILFSKAHIITITNL